MLEMPTGYSIQAALDVAGWHIFKGLKALRKGKQPVILPQEQAIAYACKHAELKLEASQQVPNWQYYA